MKNINSGTKCALYVDDFMICYRARNINHIERQLQICLDKLHKWTTEKGLKFSKEKKYLRTKYNKTIQLLRTIAHTNWGGSKETSLKLYHSLIRSKLDYGCFIYWATKRHTRKN